LDIQARLLIPDGHVGVIMGKKGETLAELRKSSGASIKVHDSHETPPCGRGTDRVVTVRQQSTNLRSKQALRSQSMTHPVFLTAEEEQHQGAQQP